MAHRVTEGNLDAKNLKAAIVVSRFNSFITERLLDGALDAALRAPDPQGVLGYAAADIAELRVIDLDLGTLD